MSSLALTFGGLLETVAWSVSAHGHGSTGEAHLTSLSEADLVSAALEQHPGAFDLIVERHRRAVYQICYRFIANHEDASDLTQEVFLRAFRGLRTFKGNAALATWLHRIAVNVCLNRVAAKAPATAPIGDDDHVDTSVEPA